MICTHVACIIGHAGVNCNFSPSLVASNDLPANSQEKKKYETIEKSKKQEKNDRRNAGVSSHKPPDESRVPMVTRPLGMQKVDLSGVRLSQG